MKALISAAFAAALLLSGPILADEAKPADQSQPIQLTAAQLEAVTAGAGNIAQGSPVGATIPPWSALIDNAGLPPILMDPGESNITVRVPDANP